MKIMLLIAISLLCLAPQAHADAASRIATQAELDQVVTRLNKPDTKMAALAELITFAQLKVFQVGSVIFFASNPVEDALESQAATAVKGHQDLPTVTQALASPDRLLRLWGVWQFPLVSPYVKTDKQWLALLPEIEQRTSDEDSGIRGIAYQKLADLPSEQTLLSRRLAIETVPGNIVDLISETHSAPYGAMPQSLFLGYFKPLLQNKDEGVRIGALDFIGSTKMNAPMYQMTYDHVVYDRVVVLTHSVSKNEKQAALFALAELQRQNAATGNTNSKPVK